MLRETLAAKERFEQALAEMLRTQAECESHMAKQNRADTFKAVTGRSALDNAVESTRRMIDSLERTVDQIRRDIAGGDQAGGRGGIPDTRG